MPAWWCPTHNQPFPFIILAVTGPSGILDVTVVYVDPAEHCCQDSSDEDNLSAEWSEHAAPQRKAKTADDTHRISTYLAPRNPNREGSSGYSSINGASPTSSVEGSCGVPLKPTSALSLGSAMNKEPCLPRYLESCLQSVCARSSDGKCDRRQVKRKNIAEHSEERVNLGFLSLWLHAFYFSRFPGNSISVIVVQGW